MKLMTAFDKVFRRKKVREYEEKREAYIKQIMVGGKRDDHVLLHNTVSWHLLKIMSTSQKTEAQFHWRMVRYYTKCIQELFPDFHWDTEKTHFEKMKKSGNAVLLVEAIERFDLMNLPEY